MFFSTASRHASKAARLGFLLLAAVVVSTPARGAERRISLTEAIGAAETHAFGIKAAYHDSLSAEHGLRAARDAWFPSLAAGGNVLGYRPDDPLALGPIQIGAAWQEIYAANLRLSYPLYTGGRRTNDIRRQRANVGAASSQLAATKLANAYDCRQAYIGLLVADRTVGSAEASAQRIAIIKTDVQNLFAVGMADSIDILETEVSQRGVDRLLEQTRNERRNACLSLARLLGAAETDSIVPTGAIPEPDPTLVVRPAEKSEPARRPELSVYDHQIESARYQRAIVKSNVLPVLSGMGGYALVKPDIGDRETNWQDAWFLGLTLAWDLNLGGKEFSESGQALEKVRSLEMKRKDLEDSLALQARIAWNNIEEAYAVYRITRDELNIARRRFALAEDKQRAGQMAVNRLLELESDLTQTEQQFEAARLRYFAAVTDYLYAVGSDAIRGGL
jgi:outer membrane protein TolC